MQLRGISWVRFIKRDAPDIVAGHRETMRRFREQSRMRMFPYFIPCRDPAKSTIEAVYDEPVLFQPEESEKDKEARKQAVATFQSAVKQAKETYCEIENTWIKSFRRLPPAEGCVNSGSEGNPDDDEEDDSDRSSNYGSDHGSKHDETASQEPNTDGGLSGSEWDFLQRDGQLNSKGGSNSSWISVPSQNSKPDK